MKRWHLILVLTVLALLSSSFFPYSRMRGTRHRPLRDMEEISLKPFPDNDGDLLSDLVESYLGTNISHPDSDGDLFPDGAEYVFWNLSMIESGREELGPAGDADDDGLPNILDPDSDGDGVPDGWEVNHGLSPWRADTDGDGRSDRLEYYIQYNFDAFPPPVDEDGDLIPDRWERFFEVDDPAGDPDDDGVTNLDEWIFGSDPNIRDERYGYDDQGDFDDYDFDGVSDRLENAIGLDARDEDTDGDGIGDGEEILLGLLPFKEDTDEDKLWDNAELLFGSSPISKDTDMDGLPDYLEVVTQPDIPDTDRDLVPDGDEMGIDDPDGDGLSTVMELDDTDGNTTAPLDPDTDGDGLSDGREDRNKNGRRDGNDPTDSASDWGRGGETDPNNRDTDGGGVSDRNEIGFFLDPLDPGDDWRFDFREPELPDYDPDVPRVDIWDRLFNSTVLVVVSIVLILFIVYIVLRRSGRRDRKKLVEDLLEILGRAEKELYSLHTDDKIREVIFRIYISFQKALAGRGFMRGESMTVREFEDMIEKELPVPTGPVSRLTGVFEEARYSDHRLGVPDKNRAVRAFREFREELEAYIRRSGRVRPFLRDIFARREAVEMTDTDVGRNNTSGRAGTVGDEVSGKRGDE